MDAHCYSFIKISKLKSSFTMNFTRRTTKVICKNNSAMQLRSYGAVVPTTEQLLLDTMFQIARVVQLECRPVRLRPLLLVGYL